MGKTTRKNTKKMENSKGRSIHNLILERICSIINASRVRSMGKGE